MKICIYLENYIAGGVDSVIANKINNWPGIGDEIILVCNCSHDGLKEILKKRITAGYNLIYVPVITLPDIYNKFLPVNKIGRFMFKFFWLYPRYLLLLYNITILWIFLKRLSPDAIFIHNGGYPGADSARAAVISAKFSGIKNVHMVVHNLAKKSDILRRGIEDFIDTTMDKYSKIICVSNKSKETILKNRKIRQDMRVIYNGTQDIIFPSDSEMRNFLKSYGISNGSKIIGMVGSYDKRKGHENLIATAHILKTKMRLANIVYLIFGKGQLSDKERLEREILRQHLEGEVILCGFMAEIYKYYKIFDIFVQPSTESESLPMTILEAMASGIPIIATDVGGAREMVIEGVTGFIVPPNAPQAMSEMIFKIFSDNELLVRMGQMSRRSFESNFTARQMSKKYYDLICR